MIRPAGSAMQDYSSVATGFSPSATKKAQSNIAEATVYKLAGTAKFIAIDWAIGHQADPCITRPLAQLSDWRRLWLNADEATRAEVKALWPKWLLTIKGNRGWAAVQGPATATIATLNDIGWTAVTPHQWLSPDCQHYHTLTDGNADFQTVLDIITHQIRARQWTHHFDDWDADPNATNDMNALPDLQPAKAAYRLLLRDNLHTEARALTSVVLNRSWSAQRKHDTFSEHSPQCTRCGHPIETATRRFWECPANDSLGVAIKRSQRLRTEATRADAPPFWTRAIIPRQWRPKRRAPQQPQVWVSSNWTTVTNDHRTLFGSDGSGGVASDLPTLRGWEQGSLQDSKHQAQHHSSPSYTPQCLVNKRCQERNCGQSSLPSNTSSGHDHHQPSTSTRPMSPKAH